jgi:2-octaprenyl-6-methoxyphenol hydroxylase
VNVERFDVVIAGGGLVGASFALALRATRLKILLIENIAPESAAQPSFDDRTTALGNGSRQIFESLGVWERMRGDAGAIRSIHVSDAGRFGFARLDAREQDIEAFGFVVPNRVIGRVLWEALRAAPNISLAMPAKVLAATASRDEVLLEIEEGGARRKVHAALAVAADGANSLLRQGAGIEAAVEDYDQVAIVVNAEADKPNTGEAFERFTPSGPLAVLPVAGGSYAVVWAVRPERARELLALDDAGFLAELMRVFGWRAGRWRKVGKRNTYPLALTRAEETTAKRIVLIGNAAQALHPVAGQGFNLGLRDAATLAEMLASGGPDVGADDVLAKFAAWRAEDRQGVTRFTDSLVKLFGDERPGMGLARNFGLLLFDLSPAAKRALSRVSWGFAGRMPRLARGLRLE